MSPLNTARSGFPLALLNGLFAVYCLLAVTHLLNKPGISLPPECRYPVYVTGTLIANEEALEFLAGLTPVGTSYEIVSEHGGVQPFIVTAGRYYSGFSVWSSAAIALLVYGFGVMVYLFRRDDPAAFVFHCGTVLVSSALIGVKTMVMMKPHWVGFLGGGWYFLSYSIVAVSFLHFTILFPGIRFRRFRILINPLYGLAVLIGGLYHYSYVQALLLRSTGLFERASVIGSIQNLFIFLVFMAGFVSLIVSYRSTETTAQRLKLRWVFYGLTIGPGPFIFLWVLPQAFRLPPLVPEIGFKIVLLLVPATFAIAIVRHRALDIDFLINRSMVYGVVIGVFVVLYAGIVVIAAQFITVWSPQSSMGVSLATAVATALLFDPVRRKLQNMVDRSFFRIQYNFRETQRELSRVIMDCVNEEEIATNVVNKIESLIPAERIGFFVVDRLRLRLRLLAHSGFGMLEGHNIPLEISSINSDLTRPIAREGAVEPGTEHDRGDERVLARWGMALILPMLNRSGGIQGFLVLGDKKSGMRYSLEDIDLLNGLARQAAMALERLALHQKLVLEHAETKRLSELSEAKSFFISSVTHDLRTPLTSIRIFAELLEERLDIDPPERQKYLRIIRSETDRLSRLINNVLDFSRVERGVREYVMKEIEINEVVEHVLNSMQYQFSSHNCIVETELSPDPIFVSADPDAIMEVLDNLFSNALRYTPLEKKLKVATRNEGGLVSISVNDNGIGMTAAEIESLGTPFFRTEAAKTHGKGGTGLGLSVVKHIVAAHGGELKIQSAPGSGSTFTIVIPQS